MIAIDWGTSSLRGALLDASGQPTDERSFARGILSVEPGGFAAVFDELFGDWMAAPGAVCLMAGMVGAKQGWREAPYCACPAGLTEIASQLLWLQDKRIAIVPGLSCQHAAPAPQLSVLHDVMRGEETQILGAMHLLGLQDALMVLPGTHSKWVQVRGGRIQSFSTYMTGEFFALLKQHSILARSLAAPALEDEAAFEMGIAVAQQGKGLLHNAFSTRTLDLFGQVESGRLHDYLSGLVIGEELRAQDLAVETPVVLIGADALTRRYRLGLARFGIEAQALGAQASWAGLWTLARQLGLAKQGMQGMA